SGIFVSEVSIAGAGLMGSRVQAAVTFGVVLLLGVIFAGMLAHGLRVAYGGPGGDAQPSAVPSRRVDLPWLAAVVPLALVVVVFGVIVPEPISALFEDVAG